MSLKIGIIVHGPGIIDTGEAKRIIGILSNYGEVSCRLGGTMGRTAVIDANLEDIINIEDKLLPSQSIQLLSEDNDILFLLNYGKSTVTGHTFGYKVLNNVGKQVNLVQIERPGESDGIIIQWNKFSDINLIKRIAHDLKLPITNYDEVIDLVEDLTGYSRENNRIERKVAGVSPEENIMLNGIIIGKVTSNNLTIISENNQIIEMKGGIIKQHGLEKLGDVDLSKAIIKTGLLRKSENINPRIINHERKDKLKVMFLDHAAEDIYKYKDIDLLVTIGDDTTLLSSDILYRFSIPIIGITDGDLDKVVLKGFRHDDSLIIQVKSGYDDIIGNIIHELLFKSENYLIIDDMEEFKEKIISIINNQKISYKFVDKQLVD
ncbi:DUF2117 family protein [Methanosphaera sp. WGK6]|uniref:DUF2117 family protein n=1 Tax=Methanosphaera sp. WGK6 TaxID=1561964 RepID=UPI00084CB1C2|nr:DUF2117 domain-containing protein [Methanosphaera sp. WGK6]OED30552.1 hypothetical protein NL43_02745 [Methanosphaera sp. WGK6]